MRALQVILKQEVTRNDAIAMIDWMENDEVTKYLNEATDITTQIRDTINRVNIAILTHHFNQNGSFYIICNNSKPIGFLKIVSKGKEGELVIVIGDESKWGQGLGSEAIRQGLNQAFFHYRLPRVIAKIKHENIASIKAFEKSGFICESELTHSKLYSISMEDYLKRILN